MIESSVAAASAPADLDRPAAPGAEPAGNATAGAGGNLTSVTGGATLRGAGAAAGAGTTATGGGTLDRLRMTVSVNRSSTKLSWRSRVSDRRTRSTSTASRCDMWFAASIPSAESLATRSRFAMPSSLANS
jgi:hypothetical protein